METLLAIDMGNTNLVAGLYQADRLVQSFRLHTERTRTVDEYGVLLKTMLTDQGHSPDQVDGVCISNVVPILSERLEDVSRLYLGQKALFVSSSLELGLTVQVDRQEEVGADLLAALVGARALMKGPLTVVDLGTATTLSFLSSDNVLKGVIIAPGLEISREAMLSRATHLPPFRLEPPPFPYGTNTVHCLQAGILVGHACLIDGLIERTEDHLGRTTVVATGGLAETVAGVAKRIERVEPNLVLDGIRRIWKLNRHHY